MGLFLSANMVYESLHKFCIQVQGQTFEEALEAQRNKLKEKEKKKEKKKESPADKKKKPKKGKEAKDARPEGSVSKSF